MNHDPRTRPLPHVAPKDVVKKVLEKAHQLKCQVYWDSKYGRTYLKVKSQAILATQKRLILGSKWEGPIGSILQEMHEYGLDAFEVYDTWSGPRGSGPCGIRVRTR